MNQQTSGYKLIMISRNLDNNCLNPVCITKIPFDEWIHYRYGKYNLTAFGQYEILELNEDSALIRIIGEPYLNMPLNHPYDNNPKFKIYSQPIYEFV